MIEYLREESRGLREQLARSYKDINRFRSN
jgi:hypothetical protein